MGQINNNRAAGISSPVAPQIGWQAFISKFTAHRLKRGVLYFGLILFALSAAVIHFVGIVKQAPGSERPLLLLAGLTIAQVGSLVALVALPTRRLLLAAALVEALGFVGWLVAHNLGISDGLAVWKPETLGVPDLYLPFIEGISAVLLLCLAARTLTPIRRTWRILIAALPYLFLLSLLLWAVANSKIAVLVVVILLLAANLPVSLNFLFLPAVGLLVVFLLSWLILPRLRVMTKGVWRIALPLLPVILVTNLLASGGVVSAANTVWFSEPAAINAPANQLTPLAYCSPYGSPLAMDLSEPAEQAMRPAPAVFYIHGGETILGSRTLADGSLDGMYFTQLRDELLSRGFVVGSIDYGLSPLYRTSDQVKEAKCAVRFLRANATVLGIDPQHIGVYGTSQGGYISAMVGTVGPDAGYDVGQYLDQSSAVQAVVDMWGPTDLTNWSGSPSWISVFTEGRSGADLRAASPVTYVAAGDPPFLILHGTDDWFIAPHHSQDLAKLLQAKGVLVTLVMVQHDSHGLAVPTAGQIEQPSPDTLVQMISNFLTKTLKP